MTDNILDDLFHGCAFAAYLEVAAETGQWPPDSERTRLRAYRLYEAELTIRSPQLTSPSGCATTRKDEQQDRESLSELGN